MPESTAPRHLAPISVTGEVLAERLQQVVDGRREDHDLPAWSWLLARRVTDLLAPPELGTGDDPRRLLIEVAAIAVAAVESLDRRASP